MQSDVPWCSLEDVVEDILDRRGVTPFKLGGDFASVGHRVVSAKVVKGGRIQLDADEPRFVDQTIYRKWMRTPLRRGDVIITSEAPLGELAFLHEDVDWVLGQRLFAIRPKTTRLHGRYLYYALQTQKVRADMLGRASGTTVQGIRQAELRLVRVPLPDLTTQIKISELLGALDDRIDVLRQTNGTLESIAQTLFKSWFVDFDPVRAKAEGREPDGMDAAAAALFPAEFEESEFGRIPKGWKVVRFAETVNVIGGGTPKTSVATYWGGEIPWFSVVDAPAAGQVFTLSTEKSITTEGVRNSSTRMLPTWATIISARGTVGKLAMVGTPMAMNQSCYGLTPKRSGTEPLVYLSAQRLVEELKRLAHGGVFDTITRDTLASVKVVYPPPAVTAAFASLVRPLFEQIQAGVSRTATLVDIRDALLPRLISGKLRLPDAEAMLETA